MAKFTHFDHFAHLVHRSVPPPPLEQGHIHIWQLPAASSPPARSPNSPAITCSPSLSTALVIANRYYAAIIPHGQTQHRLTFTARGKAYFKHSPLQCSITHTAATLFIGFSHTHALGLDCESLSRTLNRKTMLKLSHRFFAYAETNQLEQFSEDNAAFHRQFLNFWTQKEAYAKAFDQPLFKTLSIPRSSMERKSIVQTHTLPPITPPATAGTTAFVLSFAIATAQLSQAPKLAMFKFSEISKTPIV